MKRLAIRIPDDLYEELRRLAYEQRKSVKGVAVERLSAGAPARGQR